MLRILIADDHGLLRAGLRSMFRDEPGMKVVGEAADGHETVLMAHALRPDVVLADISMPGMSGIEVAAELHRTLPETRVLILTMHEDGGLLQEALRAGAAGYLIKRAAEADLIRAITTVARGEVYIHEDMRAAMLGQPLTRPAVNANAGTRLSEQETEILRLIRQGYTNRHIAEVMQTDSAAIEGIYASLVGKLGVRGRVGLIQYANEHGIS
ncbi:MAG TPA: response regulator transcription factor [Anaerolineae bacterium]